MVEKHGYVLSNRDYGIIFGQRRLIGLDAPHCSQYQRGAREKLLSVSLSEGRTRGPNATIRSGERWTKRARR